MLKKPPQGQLNEEKLVPSSVGSEHLGISMTKTSMKRESENLARKIQVKSKVNRVKVRLVKMKVKLIEILFQMSSFAFFGC